MKNNEGKSYSFCFNIFSVFVFLVANEAMVTKHEALVLVTSGSVTTGNPMIKLIFWVHEKKHENSELLRCRWGLIIICK